MYCVAPSSVQVGGSVPPFVHLISLSLLSVANEVLRSAADGQVFPAFHVVAESNWFPCAQAPDIVHFGAGDLGSLFSLGPCRALPAKWPGRRDCDSAPCLVNLVGSGERARCDLLMLLPGPGSHHP